MTNIFSGHFCEEILNLQFEARDEITGHEIIIAFREDSIGLKHMHSWDDDNAFMELFQISISLVTDGLRL